MSQALQAVGVLVVAAAVALAVRNRRRDAVERWLAVLLLPSALLTVLLGATAVLESTTNAWNDIRLGPSVGLLHGFPVYSSPGEGPMNGYIYGPVGPILYLPAALMPTPSSAVRAGATVAFLMALGPIIVLLLTESDRSRRLLASGCVAVACLYMFTTKGMWHMAFSLHVDGPAMGLGVLACSFVYTTRQRKSPSWVTASAFAVVLAVGTKQVMVPAVLAIPTYLWLADGLETARRWTLALVAVGACALVLVALLVDVPAMLYYTLVVPAEHELRFGLTRVLADMTPRLGPPAATIVLFALLGSWPQRHAGTPRGWVRDNPWLLPVFMGLFCLPTSLLGRAKIGGAVPVLNFTIYPVFAGALVACLRASGQGWRIGPFPARQVATGYVLMVLVLLLIETAPQARRLPSVVQDLPHDAEAAAFAFALAHPGQVYLPYHPLVTLMSEGRYYHVLDPLMTWQFLRDASVTDSDADRRFFLAHVPPQVRFVLESVDGGTPLTHAQARPGWERYVRLYMPSFTRHGDVGLRGWRALLPASNP